MTELELHTPRQNTSLPAKIQYAKCLADSGLLPDQYRRNPANVLYAVEYGEMLGLSPIAAINGINVIEGKPTASAGLISALVRRAGHRLRVAVTYDAQNLPVATAEIVRSDDPEFTYRCVWDIPRAVRANLCTIRDGRPFARSQKGKVLPWEAYPEAMVKARAISEVARDACEEALSGVHYTPEELGAEVDEEGNVVGGTVEQPAQQPDEPETVDAELVPDETWAADWKRRVDDADTKAVLKGLWKEFVVQVQAGAVPDPSPELEAHWKDRAAEITAAESPEAAATETPLARRMYALFHEVGWGDRGDRMRATIAIIGRDVASSSNLTAAEVQAVVDTLDRVSKQDDPAMALTAIVELAEPDESNGEAA